MQRVAASADPIELTPVAKRAKQFPSISMQGRLAGFLAGANDEQKPSRTAGFDDETAKLVSGVGFEPPLGEMIHGIISYSSRPFRL